jgi:NTE family protein
MRYPPPRDDMQIGIALSSGGAAGLAHIGVLEELLASGLRPRCVAGTSAGAIVGATFAAQRLDAFRKRVIGLTLRRRITLFDPVWPRAGFLAGHRAMDLVRPFVGTTIEKLPLRFAAVATDLHAGCSVVMTRGDVIDALRASIAIPGIFTPLRHQGRLLVDGALTDPLPVSAARGLGANFVIAVNVIPAKPAARIPIATPAIATASTVRRWLGVIERWITSPQAARGNADMRRECVETSIAGNRLMEILSHASAVVQANIVAARLRDQPPDFCIAPEVADVGLFDLHRAEEAIECGRAAARAVLPELMTALQHHTWQRRILVRSRIRQVLSRRVPAPAAA